MEISPKMREKFEKAADEIVQCMEFPQHFIEKHVKIMDQVKGRSAKFKLWPCQVETLNDWILNKLCITLKTRQIGISWLAGAWLLHQLIFRQYFQAIVISKKEEDAIGFMRRVVFMYNNLPEFFKQYAPLYKPPTQERIILKDRKGKEGSMAKVEASGPNAGRSNVLNMLILDEAAFMQEGATIFTASQPTLENANGQALVISTANGYDRFFQKEWDVAKRGLSDFKPRFIPWSAHPGRDEKWYAHREKIAMAKGQNAVSDFRQEYPRNPTEAFKVTGNTFFDPDLIEKFASMKKPGIKITGNLGISRNPVTGEVVPKITRHRNGHLIVWEYPKPGGRYCGGVDTAEGTTSGDFSVCAIYDRDSGAQVAEFVDRMDTFEWSKKLYLLGKYYNYALLNIEMNSIGESVINYLVKQRHYPNVFRQMRYDERSNKKIKKIGWKTTAMSKRLALDALAGGMRQMEIIPRSDMLFSEMKRFMIEKTERGNYIFHAAGDAHDDRVISHSLAAITLQEMPVGKPIRRQIQPQARDRLKRAKRLRSGSIDIDRLFS